MTVNRAAIDFETYLKSSSKDQDLFFLNLFDWNYPLLKVYYDEEVYLKSTLFILVQKGKATLDINHQLYVIEPFDIVLLSFGHFLKIKKASRDFKCRVLYVSNEEANQMYSVDMLYKRVKYGVKMYKNPLFKPTDNQFSTLLKRMDLLEDFINEENQLYRKEKLLNGLRIFFLDLSNSIELSDYGSEEEKPSREEIYFQRFLELVSQFYKSEHSVDFYANKIFITPHYLTLIVKKFTGQTVSDLVYHLLYTEAKIMLQNPNFSIQQIAEELHFSDQSAFGKFFKRKSGKSPREFRAK